MKYSKAISYIILVVLILSVIGIVVKFTNGFTQDFATFYVTVDGKDITSEAFDYAISEEDSLTVEVKYLLNNVGADAKGYSLKILPTDEESKDFKYISNDVIYSFQAEEDFSKGFNIELGETSFTISSKGSLTDTLAAVRGYEITHSDGEPFENMFILVVTSNDGAQSVKIHFTIMEDVYKVELDSTSIIL